MAFCSGPLRNRVQHEGNVFGCPSPKPHLDTEPKPIKSTTTTIVRIRLCKNIGTKHGQHNQQFTRKEGMLSTVIAARYITASGGVNRDKAGD